MMGEKLDEKRIVAVVTDKKHLFYSHLVCSAITSEMDDINVTLVIVDDDENDDKKCKDIVVFDPNHLMQLKQEIDEDVERSWEFYNHVAKKGSAFDHGIIQVPLYSISSGPSGRCWTPFMMHTLPFLRHVSSHEFELFAKNFHSGFFCHTLAIDLERINNFLMANVRDNLNVEKCRGPIDHKQLHKNFDFVVNCIGPDFHPSSKPEQVVSISMLLKANWMKVAVVDKDLGLAIVPSMEGLAVRRVLKNDVQIGSSAMFEETMAKMTEILPNLRSSKMIKQDLRKAGIIKSHLDSFSLKVHREHGLHYLDQFGMSEEDQVVLGPSLSLKLAQVVKHNLLL